MDSFEPPQSSSDEKIIFVVKRNTRNIWIAKLIILLGLTGLTSHLFVQESAKQYQKGQELTPAKYLENFEPTKQRLLQSETYISNVPLSVFVVFIAVSFLLGAYELTALMVSLIIGKFINR